MKICLLLFFCALLAPTAFACGCVSIDDSSKPCHRQWSQGEAIFFGRVLSVERNLDSPGPTNLFVQAVRIAVTDSFRGAAGAGKEQVVYTGMGGGDCGYPFKVGTSYLIYARPVEGKLTTGICTYTQPEVLAAAVLSELCNVRDGKGAGDVSGVVGIAPQGNGYDSLPDFKPLAQVPVHATAGQVHFSTTTDNAGVYSFSKLPAGDYRIEEELPAGYAIRPGSSVKAVIGKNDGSDQLGAGCTNTVYAYPDGVISGTVVNRDGRPMPGFITIEPSDPTEARAARMRGGLPGYESNDGRFTLSQLPPGRYRLVLRPEIDGKVNFQKVFYWPGAGGLDLALGQHLENVRFEVTVP
jgi:Prealbumin-like fold domain